VESWLALFRDPRVDLVTNSGGISFGEGRKPLADEGLVGWRIFERLVAKISKTFFAAAGNDGPQTKIFNSAASSSAVITVGPTRRLRLAANFGSRPLRRIRLRLIHRSAPAWMAG